MWIGITLAILRLEEKIRDIKKKEISNVSANCEEIFFFNSFRILVGKLLGSADLFSFNFEIVVLLSSLFSALMENESSIG